MTNPELQVIDDTGIDPDKGGLAAQYRKRVVGEGGVCALCLYEAYNLFAAPLPGALGLALRSACLGMIVRDRGRRVIVGAHATFRGVDKIRLGHGVMLDDFVTLDAMSPRRPGIIIGDGTFIERFSLVSTGLGDASHVTLGNGCKVGPNVKLYGIGGLTIGDNCLIAHDTSVIGGRHSFESVAQPIREQPKYASGIVIEDDVWIGAGVRVLDGVSIGRGSIIGAGAIVTKSIPSYCVAVGAPCKPIRKRIPGDQVPGDNISNS